MAEQEIHRQARTLRTCQFAERVRQALAHIFLLVAPPVYIHEENWTGMIDDVLVTETGYDSPLVSESLPKSENVVESEARSWLPIIAQEDR